MAIREKPCIVCGKLFIGTERALYCKPKCKQTKYRERLKESKNGSKAI